MKSCPNCSWSNEDQNRFCENCGADFSGLAATGQRAVTPTSTWSSAPQTPPPAPQLSQWEVQPDAPDWRMAPLPPEEEPAAKGTQNLAVDPGIIVSGLRAGLCGKCLLARLHR